MDKIENSNERIKRRFSTIKTMKPQFNNQRSEMTHDQSDNRIFFREALDLPESSVVEN